MTGIEADFLRMLRETFKVEATEHLRAIGSGLLELEKVTEPKEQLRLIETVFRGAHSLKGAARAVNFTDIESICQSLESLFVAWKRRESLPTPQALDTAHNHLNKISQILSVAATPNPTVQAGGESLESAAPDAQAAVVRSSQTVRIAVDSLDTQLLEAEEMLSAKLSAQERAADLGALAGSFAAWRKEWARVQPAAHALRQAQDRPNAPRTAPYAPELANFFTWNQDYWRALEEKVNSLRRAAEQDRLLVSKLVDDLLENSKQLLMLPVATLSALLAKVVRDLCRDQNKQAEFVIQGDEVTLDRRILEELKDPLIHLLRNCVDHGIELPEQRQRLGKPRQARIVLAVTPLSGNQVEISVSDDGAGIDVEEVRAAAAKRSLKAIDPSTDSTLALVFEPEVSTSPMVTQVSGRGLGLAIVREKTEKLGGRVALETRPNAGTTFRMTVPLTLSTYRGVLVKVKRRLFVVPTAQIERVLRFKSQDIQTVEGRPTLCSRGRTIALVELAGILQLERMPEGTAQSEATQALILGAGDQCVAFAVDAVLDEREVLVKRFTKPLSRVRNIAGATILGSGEVVPILNVHDLLKSARTASSRAATPTPTQPISKARKKILVVEDSVTSRALLKGILESAGYTVKTAVDGIEGFNTLCLEEFDLVVSDVEMPRMNGFDLTARIRAERDFADLPVVLVTALESREDRERGIDVGASAYLVKSSFDQTNLFEALRRLL
jgi:two-component system, chemotaxis family, sensor kinase CheA